MWFSWTLLGLLQISSNRYLKHKFSWRQTMHTFSGIFLCLTVASSFTIILDFATNWVLYLNSLHTILGFTVVIICACVTIGGLSAEYIRRSDTMEWKTNLILTMKKFHRYFGYFVLFLSQCAVSTGIYKNYKFTDKSFGWTLICCNLIFYVTVLIILEFRHRKILQSEESFNKVQENMSVHDFEDAVANGKLLVLLDEFVLDLQPFIAHHPGGKFVLKHNIGQDVSKFFHGGYSLEGNLGPRPAAGHKHTNYARKIVNQLIVAQLDRKVTVQGTICTVG